MATISRLLKIIGLFCRISSLLYSSFAEETYNLKGPTNRSQPIEPFTPSIGLFHMFIRLFEVSIELFHMFIGLFEVSIGLFHIFIGLLEVSIGLFHMSIELI